MHRILLIAIFGTLGVLTRYGLGAAVPRVLPPPFPYATFLINLTGAFLIGAVYVMGNERSMISPGLRLAVMVGFLGGYTTFSSYCLESVRLLEEARYVAAAAYVSLSNLLGLGAAGAGMWLARKLIA